ncbi:MAG: DUF2752 domain-containing protein [Clostridia bacterium]|nr:DUF2752 domain-containing protein [Clostridia bacterium]
MRNSKQPSTLLQAVFQLNVYNVVKIKNWKGKLFFCALFAVVLILWYVLLGKCLYVWLWGIQCPGCGMTRAYLALLHLDIKGAFSMHPMFWSVPILLAYYFFDGKLFKVKWLNNTLLVLIVAGFLINWLVRLCL